MVLNATVHALCATQLRPSKHTLADVSATTGSRTHVLLPAANLAAETKGHEQSHASASADVTEANASNTRIIRHNHHSQLLICYLAASHLRKFCAL
jgi:hypothetical protein